ncbi:MAG TPA: formimidoylglutamate deiminase [Pyrinomonadaceae bacterium]|jgi:formimidoylglutamate deiminase|nr:formimidoylglutamate deiminase [Pyrinomonadaceae bacterium]
MSETPAQLIAWIPDLIYQVSGFAHGMALVCDSSGRIVRLVRVDQLTDERRINLRRRAILPGMINAHSHAFQRVIRGRTEYRTANQRDSFWTWRELMYSAATRLTPEDVYDASRMAFLEMALNGITAVGEFHYLHHAPDGTPYDDPNLLAKEVMRAAGDVGLRVALLRVAYARSGFNTDANPRQARFIESDAELYLKNLEALVASIRNPTVREGAADDTGDEKSTDTLAHARVSDTSWVGIAPHSVRAVPLDYLKSVAAYAHEHDLKIHMHVAEQPAEVSACVQEYGRTPVALLQSEGLLSERFTAVHAIHVTPKAIASFAGTGAMVCACPTTERNLGDGVVPADQYLKHRVSICLGTDSHAQIDLFEDARELEYHLRLQKLERAIVSRDPTVRESAMVGIENESTLPHGRVSDLLFGCATVNGARSIGAPGGLLAAGEPADFFTIDLDDPTVAGAGPDDLLPAIVFAASRAAVREVVVGGKPIVSEGQHLMQEDVIERFNELQKKLWS